VLVAAGSLAVALLAPASGATPAGGVDRRDSGASRDPGGRSAAFSGRLLAALRAAGFDDVVDFDKQQPGQPAPQVTYSPHVDLAVIELDARGRAVAAANVQQSRDFPNGRIVPIGPDLRARGTDFRSWDLSRWDDLTPQQFATTPYPAGSALVPGTRGAPFMSPYPASTFKLLVAVQVLRLVDAGRLTLSQPTVNQAPGAACIEGGSLPAAGDEPTVAQALDSMITYSDNTSTCLLLQQLHATGQLDPASNRLNATFARLGMPTLQVNGTDPLTGARWGVGSIDMTAMDTARLLLLLQGGRLSFGDRGGVSPSELLSKRSRTLLLSLLGQQGFHEVLSTTNWCGLSYPQQGIPARVPERWVGADGTVTVDGIPYGQDVRPCNAAAQVVFAHKTGLTENYGSDAGIVTALPGQDGRRYIVVVFTNVGYRYSDASQAATDGFPCFTGLGICYPEKFAQLGRSIDDLMRRS
jgi:CubicO group peptidase (beta-lactamase class C family)